MDDDFRSSTAVSVESNKQELTENELVAKAKSHWEAVVDTLPQLICLIDEQGRIVRANRTYERWGLGKVQTAAGCEFHQRIHPHCTSPECYLKQHVDFGRMASFSAPANAMRVYDEKLSRYLKIQVSSMHHAWEKIGSDNRCSLFVAEDVTCRVGLEHKTSSSEEKLHLLVESVSDLIVQHGSDGTVFYLSPASITMLGCNPQALIGANLFEQIHDSDRKSVMQSMIDISAGEVVECNTFRLKNATGGWCWVEARTHAIVNSSGKGEYVSIMRDVSERRREDELALKYSNKLEQEVTKKTGQLTMVIDMLKQQIEENERDRLSLEALGRRYTSLVENTLTGIYLEQESSIVFCNERFAEIFGYSLDEITGMALNKLMEEVEGHEVLADINKGANASMSNANVVEGRRSDGERIWMKTSHARLENDDGVFVLGNVIDVSEQVRVQEELQRSEQAMHQLSSLLITAQENERKRIANELHDGIGQRLSAIKFSVEDILRNAEKASDHNSLERMNGVVDKIRDTIEEVRRTSMDLRPSILDDLGLVATINWFCREFGSMFPGIEVQKEVMIEETTLREELKVVIFRIMQEALHNITKHASATRVEISLKQVNEALVLEVQDNGRGFILDAEVVNGPSLGLKSMRERAELMGGSFDLVSACGEGTRISVRWPEGIAIL